MHVPSPDTEANDRPRYWFPAKRYGWGWGLPAVWQGWVVLVGFIGLAVVVARVVPPERSVVGFVAAMSGLSLALIAICWWKGEPPRWRWG